MDTESSQLPAFASWAIVEIMGRKQFAGMVSEQVLAGKGFLRVDVPETKHAKAFTKYFGTSSIYALTPTDEETARRFAEALREQPFETWRIALPAAPSYGPPDDPEAELRRDRYLELSEGDGESKEDDVGPGYDPDAPYDSDQDPDGVNDETDGKTALVRIRARAAEEETGLWASVMFLRYPGDEDPDGFAERRTNSGDNTETPLVPGRYLVLVGAQNRVTQYIHLDLEVDAEVELVAKLEPAARADPARLARAATISLLEEWRELEILPPPDAVPMNTLPKEASGRG